MFYIYRITNLINGKTYIGQHKYKTLDDNYIGSGKILKQAYMKYGIENFKKEIICKNVQYKETIDDMEKFYIKKEREQNPNGCYNIAYGGQGGNTFEGKHHSDETKRKMSEVMKEKYSRENSPLYGKKHSEETRKKISKANKGKHGKHHSEEARKKISEACKGRPSPNKGKCLSDETRKKLSEVHKGKRWFTNGKVNKLSKICPEGFHPGRTKSK